MEINIFQLYQQYRQSLAIRLHYVGITFLRVCHRPFDKCIFDIVHGENINLLYTLIFTRFKL